MPGVSLGFTGLFLAGYASGDAVARLRRAGAGGHNPDTGLGVVVSGTRGRHQWCSRRPVVPWLAWPHGGLVPDSQAVMGMWTRLEPTLSLVDRRRERAALDGLLEDLRSGRGRALVV